MRKVGNVCAKKHWRVHSAFASDGYINKFTGTLCCLSGLHVCYRIFNMMWFYISLNKHALYAYVD